MLLMRKPQLISALLLLCLLVIAIAQPVQAGPASQTVPTAGPRPTREPSSTPDNGSNPVPTAILATSPAGGIQPTATLTHTPTQTAATATAITETATATAVQDKPADAPRAISTQLAPGSLPDPASQVVLPTLAVAVESKQTAQPNMWCFPVGALILIVVILIIVNLVRPGKKST